MNLYDIYTHFKMDYANVNLDTITLCKSGKSLKILNENKKPLEMQSCKLYMPFDVSRFENKWSGMYDYSVSCYTDDSFKEFFSKLDKRVSDLLSPFTESPLNDTLKQNKDFPKLFRLKLPRDSYGNFNVVVFDKNREKIMLTEENIEEIFCKKQTFKCTFQCEKISDWQGKSSILWQMTQAKLFDKDPIQPIEKSHIDYNKLMID
jgi:hypothetical protein